MWGNDTIQTTFLKKLYLAGCNPRHQKHITHSQTLAGSHRAGSLPNGVGSGWWTCLAFRIVIPAWGWTGFLTSSMGLQPDVDQVCPTSGGDCSAEETSSPTGVCEQAACSWLEGPSGNPLIACPFILSTQAGGRSSYGSPCLTACHLPADMGRPLCGWWSSLHLGLDAPLDAAPPPGL